MKDDTKQAMDLGSFILKFLDYIGISNNLVINYLNTFLISELKCLLIYYYRNKRGAATNFNHNEP